MNLHQTAVEREFGTQVTVKINGGDFTVDEGDTILTACTQAGIDTPTICYAENLTPVNACRVCVVEVEGNRTLVPSCSRPVEEAMVISTDSDRVKHSRKMVLEFLGTANDLSEAPQINEWSTEYGVDITRYAEGAERFDQPVKIQDNLYIRDYDKCVLCYKCVDACGEEAQFTFAIAMSGRGFDNRISTEFDVALPESACVYCGNCIAVCPTNALQFKTEFDLRQENNWREEEQTVTQTVCSYCGVGCNLELHVQDNQIVKVTSPADHEVTNGMLCIKGRFGWKYV
ncbi:2Fe-2S iron-sulfur cluster-binding protein [uncultured Ilumatobacter sp.]|jgi:predicted molibdopterin-dependent oxidoreductase YjgC|uniref:2Fe-2S iron-sulfur cluster-binding protein n=1 Tax=uncultured Ilumatobacter sp. TaxID=879968 RepID=UPI00374E9345|tara:strand:- start:936 stop:1793 length:858 start_codon:yes stop_codon:yes gene_type:complete